MQDHSHKFFFLAATGLMCAATMYGSEAWPSFLLPEDRVETSIAESPDSAAGRSLGLAQAVSFRTSDTLPREETTPIIAASPPSTATVVPNRTSCPADADALLSPPSVNGAIASPTPAERPAPPTQALTGAALGTGSSCPPARPDTGLAAETPAPPSASLNSQAANRLPRAATHP